jgi:lipase (class 3)
VDLADGNSVDLKRGRSAVDLNKAILYGQLVNAAYAISPSDLANRAGQVVNPDLGVNDTAFEVITSVFATDLGTDMDRLRAQTRVSIGLVLQSAAGDAVVAIRGTERILEWIEDAKFLAVKCPFLAGAGNTDDGFTAMYNSLTTATAAGSPSLTKSLAGLPWKKPATSLTICGHSLGGALATLLALDVASNTPFNNPTVYTYASPRTGDLVFANKYNMIVPNTFRIANRYDIVPKLPPPLLYEHVLGFFEISSVATGNPPKLLIKFDASCEHVLSTYLHLLSLSTGRDVLPLNSECVVPDQPGEGDLNETVEADTLQPSEPRPREPMRPSQWIDLITFNRFSPGARTTLARATQLCRAYKKKRIQLEHLLLALSERPQSQLPSLLSERQLDLLPILVPGLGSAEVPRTSDRPDELQRFPALSPNARRALSSARDKADVDGRENIEESYLLFGVLSASENASVQKLGTHGITPDTVELSPPTSAPSASEHVLAGYRSLAQIEAAKFIIQDVGGARGNGVRHGERRPFVFFVRRDGGGLAGTGGGDGHFLEFWLHPSNCHISPAG